MRQYSTIAVLALVLTLPVFAQKATLAAPESDKTVVAYEVAGWDTSISSRRVIVKLFQLNAAGDRVVGIKKVIVESWVDNDPDPEVEDLSRTWAAFLAFQQLSDNPRAGETGTVDQKINYRVLGYLDDNGLLGAVTLSNAP